MRSRVVSLAFGRRAGGARPGYCMIEAESKMLPLISKALASLAKVMPETREEVATTAKKQPLDGKRLEEIIRDELS